MFGFSLQTSTARWVQLLQYSAATEFKTSLEGYHKVSVRIPSNIKLRPFKYCSITTCPKNVYSLEDNLSCGI
jgi:hypothetical protein